MKSIVPLICIFLISFAKSQDSDQATSPLSGAFIFVKDLIQKVDDSKKKYLNSLIDNIILLTESNDNENVKEKLKDLEHKSSTSNQRCTEKPERFPIPGSCDSYIECKNGKEEKKQCPDGLRYNKNVKQNVDPCQYPSDVDCTPGSTIQPPNPTEMCPNQFGYFKTMDRFNCSSFRICDKGIGYDYDCPDGLAFNSATSRCDWPDKVPECNVEKFLGYNCPELLNPKNDMVSRGYRSPTNCQIYFLCTNRKPRRLECDEYFAFDEMSQSCLPANMVDECTEEQKYLAGQLIRRHASGKYVLIVRNNDDPYLTSRDTNLRFIPKFKRRPNLI